LNGLGKLEVNPGAAFMEGAKRAAWRQLEGFNAQVSSLQAAVHEISIVETQTSG
jgi:hypothetical protein